MFFQITQTTSMSPWRSWSWATERATTFGHRRLIPFGPSNLCKHCAYTFGSFCRCLFLIVLLINKSFQTDEILYLDDQIY